MDKNQSLSSPDERISCGLFTKHKYSMFPSGKFGINKREVQFHKREVTTLLEPISLGDGTGENTSGLRRFNPFMDERCSRDYSGRPG